MMASEVIVFPEPLSPTSPRTSRGYKSNVTRSRTRHDPFSRGKLSVRSLIRSNGSLISVPRKR